MTVMAGWGLLAEQMRRNAQIATVQAQGGGTVAGSHTFRDAMNRVFSPNENAYTAAADSLYRPVEQGGGSNVTLTYGDGSIKELIHGYFTDGGFSGYKEVVNGQIQEERYIPTLEDTYARGGATIIAGGYVGNINAYGTDPLVPTDWFIIAELITIFGLGGLIVLKVIV